MAWYLNIICAGSSVLNHFHYGWFVLTLLVTKEKKMKPITKMRIFIFGLTGATILGSMLAIVPTMRIEGHALFNLSIVGAIVLMLGFFVTERVNGDTEKFISPSDGLSRVLHADNTNTRSYSLDILESIVEPFFVVSHDGYIITANQAAAIIVENDRTSLSGTPFVDLFADPEAAMNTLDKAKSRGSIREVTIPIRRSQRESRVMTLSAAILTASGSDPCRVLVSLRDVTDAVKGEQHAQMQANYLRNLIEVSIDPLFAISPEGTITDVNDSTVAKTGISKERLIGSDFIKLFADPEAARQSYERVLSEGSVLDYPLKLRNIAGITAYVSFNASLYRNDQGGVAGIFAQARDVTTAKLGEIERDRKEWVSNGITKLNAVFQVQGNTIDLAGRIISTLTEYSGAQMGAFYIQDASTNTNALTLIASHAYTRRKSASCRFMPGEGIIGQAALERKQILISDVPDDYVRIVSGLGESVPRYLCVTPLLFEDSVKGMVEIASFNPITDSALEYLRQSAPMVAVAIEATLSRERVNQALMKSQELTTELEAQQKELQQTNAELEEQTAQLKMSEQKLQQQQADLERFNAELEEQTAQLKISEQKLQQQQTELEVANDELTQTNTLLERQKAEIEQARKNIAVQAEEVAMASKYKSEFLANMSHELRTPLNSLLLLARSLRENISGNLTEEQVESASVIFESGSDLLTLINEILDLSKIEAGRMELRLEEIDLMEVERTILSQFDHMAKAQKLTLQVVSEPGAPTRIVSDIQRLGQVLKNLIGNALKFTETGGVTLSFAIPAAGVQLSRSGLDPEHTLAIHVTDTGIGIPKDKQKIIFEAFQQADSGDKRRFGGTGLGLSISREITALLGGEIQLTSEPGKGSTFSIYLPLRIGEPGVRVGKKSTPAAPAGASMEMAPISTHPIAPPPAHVPTAVSIKDDRNTIGETDRVMLVVEDDLRFGNILSGIIRERGFKCIRAATGEEGIDLAKEYKPNGVILDIQLPGMDGWAVLNALKHDVSLRHIPVHIISVEEATAKNLGVGAIGHAAKPIGREQIMEVLERLEAASALAPKRVLVVEDDERMRKETVRIIGNGNVTVEEAETGQKAIEALRTQTFALVIMDLGLPDMQGLDLLKQIAAEKITLPPVIIHTVRELTIEEEYFLRNYADSIIIKDVRSQERLIDEVALFLHRVVRDLPEENRRAILHLRESDEPLRGKKVLIVEDDMRTMFAMARILAGHGVNPLKAEHGERALAILDDQPDIDLVLMDVMMPVMDGYEATRRIRSQERFAKLPIITLTAKAMKEDRQKCLEAGATDYLSKPVDPDRLTSLMRVLLCR